MNLYRLELKRVCKTRTTAILLAIALVLAVVMAYLPVTFIGWTSCPRPLPCGYAQCPHGQRSRLRYE